MIFRLFSISNDDSDDSCPLSKKQAEEMLVKIALLEERVKDIPIIKKIALFILIGIVGANSENMGFIFSLLQ